MKRVILYIGSILLMSFTFTLKVSAYTTNAYPLTLFNDSKILTVKDIEKTEDGYVILGLKTDDESISYSPTVFIKEYNNQEVIYSKEFPNLIRDIKQIIILENGNYLFYGGEVPILYELNKQDDSLIEYKDLGFEVINNIKQLPSGNLVIVGKTYAKAYIKVVDKDFNTVWEDQLTNGDYHAEYYDVILDEQALVVVGSIEACRTDARIKSGCSIIGNGLLVKYGLDGTKLLEKTNPDVFSYSHILKSNESNLFLTAVSSNERDIDVFKMDANGEIENTLHYSIKDHTIDILSIIETSDQNLILSGKYEYGIIGIWESHEYLNKICHFCEQYVEYPIRNGLIIKVNQDLNIIYESKLEISRFYDMIEVNQHYIVVGDQLDQGDFTDEIRRSFCIKRFGFIGILDENQLPKYTLHTVVQENNIKEKRQLFKGLPYIASGIGLTVVGLIAFRITRKRN